MIWFIGGDWRRGFLSRGDEFTCIVKKREIEYVYFVSVRELFTWGSTCVCHEDGLGWSLCCVTSVNLLSLEKKQYINWEIYIKCKGYYLKRKIQESYSLEIKKSCLSCFWKNLRSKLWLCIHGGRASMKRVVSGKRRKVERSLFGACVIEPLVSLLCIRCWSSCWSTSECWKIEV